MEEGELDEPVRPPYKGKRGGRNERCRRSLIKRSVRFSTLWPPFPWPHLSFVPKRPTPTDDLKEPPIIRQKVDRPIRKSVSLPPPPHPFFTLVSLNRWDGSNEWNKGWKAGMRVPRIMGENKSSPFFDFFLIPFIFYISWILEGKNKIYQAGHWINWISFFFFFCSSFDNYLT